MRGLVIKSCLGLYLVVQLFRSAEGVMCMKCDDVTSVNECHDVLECNPNEECFVQRFIANNLRQYFKVGCMDKSVCANKRQTLFGFGFMSLGKRSFRSSAVNKTHALFPKHLFEESHDLEFDLTHAHQHSLQSRDIEDDMPLCLECCEDEQCNDGRVNHCGSPPSPYRKCFDCPNVLSPHECTKVIECDESNVCLNHKNIATGETRYELRCVRPVVCQAIKTTIIGDNIACVTCCDEDYCNFRSCDNITTTATTAGPTYTTATTVTTAAPVTTVTTTTEPPLQASIIGASNGRYGKLLTLHCQSNLPGSQFSWKYHDLTNGLPPDTTQLADGTLLIDILSDLNNGLYSCVVARNGQIDSATVNVKIYGEKPTNVTIENRITSTGMLVMKCSANAYPVPDFRWSFGGNLNVGIPTNLQYTQDRSTAMIFNYDPNTDAGTYTCTASNFLGKGSTSVDI